MHAAQLMQHARRNIYRPGSGKVPGDDPNFVMHIEHGFRCVFTYTAVPGGLYRHLSVSVTGPKYPSPAAIAAIAELFEFTGAGVNTQTAAGQFPPSWILDRSEKEHCIVLAEELKNA